MPVVLAIHGNSLYTRNPPVVIAPFTNLTLPAFTNTPLYEGVSTPITPAAYNTAVDASRTWRIYTDQNLNSPYVTLTGTSVSYRPEVDGNPFLFQQTGLTSLTGHSVYVDEVATINGVAQTPTAKSVAAVVRAPLTATANTSALSYTQNVAIAATQPVTGAGGSGTLSYAIAPAVPAGLSFDTTTGYLSGTPTVTLASTSYTVTVSDTGGDTPASASFTLTVSASSIATMHSFSAAASFASQDGYVQLLGASTYLPTISESTGITGSGTIIGPYGATTMRFGKIADPLDSSRQVFLLGARYSDGQTFTHYGRCEMTIPTGDMNKATTTYWLAMEIYIPAARALLGAGNVFQIHASDPALNNVGGPFALEFFPAGRAGINNANINLTYYLSTDGTGTTYTAQYPYVSDNSPTYPFGPFPYDTWVKFVIKYKGSGGTGTTGLLAAWMNGTQLFSSSNINIGIVNSPSYPLEYPKCGFDDYQYGGGTNGTYQMIRSWHVVQDSGYTEPQVRALLT